jgi:hypothetical protein
MSDRYVCDVFLGGGPDQQVVSSEPLSFDEASSLAGAPPADGEKR